MRQATKQTPQPADHHHKSPTPFRSGLCFARDSLLQRDLISNMMIFFCKSLISLYKNAAREVMF